MADSVANVVIRRMGAASAIGARRHNENDIIVIIAGLWRHVDWRHVATGCNAPDTNESRPCLAGNDARQLVVGDVDVSRLPPIIITSVGHVQDVTSRERQTAARQTAVF